MGDPGLSGARGAARLESEFERGGDRVVALCNTVAFQGIDVIDVETQVQIASGLSSFTVVGLPDKAVAESRERVRAALGALGLALPAKRITVNLAPADLAKEGSHFDLPIAVAVMAAMGVLPSDALAGYVVLGELALDARVMPVPGVLPAALAASANERGLICPAAQGAKRRGPARSRCWRRILCSPWSTISRAPKCSAGRGSI